MIVNKRTDRLKKIAAAGMVGAAMQFGGCKLDDFTATSTVTLDGREVITTLIISALLDPIQAYITDGVDAFFDRFEGEEG